MKVYDAPDIRNVASHRPRRLRENVSRVGPVVRRGAVEPPRPGRRRHGDDRLRRRGNRAQDLLQTSLAHLEWRGQQDQPHRHSGLRRVRRGREGRTRGRRCGAPPRRGASPGVQVITERVFQYCQEYQVPASSSSTSSIARMRRSSGPCSRSSSGSTGAWSRFRSRSAPRPDSRGSSISITMKAHRYAKDALGPSPRSETCPPISRTWRRSTTPSWSRWSPRATTR